MTEYSHIKTFSQSPSPKILVDHLHANFPGASYHTAYEAGFCGLWVHYQFVRFGVNSIVVNPADIPTTQKEEFQKTDPIDSKKIARALRAGVLTPIYIPRQETLEIRSLLRTRASIVKNLTRFKNKLKLFLYYHGIEYPAQFQNSLTHWTKRFMVWLKEEVRMQYQSGQDALNILISEAEEQRKLLLVANRKIRSLSQGEQYSSKMSLLRGVPGIGILTAMTFLIEIEDINRFPNNDRLAGYVGLIPNCHASGENDYKGELTLRGHRVLRTLIVECAWVAVRDDPALQLCYGKYCRRMEPNKAIIRIARKLLNRIYYVLKNEKRYVPGIVR